jgi:hypothetical protein
MPHDDDRIGAPCADHDADANANEHQNAEDDPGGEQPLPRSGRRG